MNPATVRNLFLSFACLLLGVGLLMVYSASVTARPTEFEQVYLSRHFLFLGVALAGGVVAACLPAAFWRRAAPILFVATLLLLTAVLIPGLGTRVNGAQRWFRFAGWSMQPSEFAKLTLPLFLCWWATRTKNHAVPILLSPLEQSFDPIRGNHGSVPDGQGPITAPTPDPSPLDRELPPPFPTSMIAGEGPGVREHEGFSNPLVHSATEIQIENQPVRSEFQHAAGRRAPGFWARMPILFPIAGTLLLIAGEPDLGTAAFLGGIAAIALFVSGWPIANFIAAALAAIPAAAGLLVLKPYQLQRISGFVAAWRDFNQAPYQVKQSLITLGVGGTSGVGLGRGWQKLSFLPEANTDFVVAVLGEELGLVGTLGLSVVWIGLYLTGLRMLGALPHRSFEYAAGVTLLTQLVLQAALNVAVVTAMVPPKGIAHPIISYGGSSLVASILALGIITSLARKPLSSDL